MKVTMLHPIFQTDLSKLVSNKNIIFFFYVSFRYFSWLPCKSRKSNWLIFLNLMHVLNNPFQCDDVNGKWSHNHKNYLMCVKTEQDFQGHEPKKLASFLSLKNSCRLIFTAWTFCGHQTFGRLFQCFQLLLLSYVLMF